MESLLLTWANSGILAEFHAQHPNLRHIVAVLALTRRELQTHKQCLLPKAATNARGSSGIDRIAGNGNRSDEVIVV